MEFYLLKLRKLQPESSRGTASIPSQKGLVGGRNGSGQADRQSLENMNIWPPHGNKDCQWTTSSLAVSYANGSRFHFNTHIFPENQRACSRWLEGQTPMQDLCLSEVWGFLQHPVESKASVRDAVLCCFSCLLITNCETEINNSNVG